MKAVEIKKNGGPEVLELKDITLDKPDPDQVTIEQKAIGLNYIDTYHRSGLYPLKMPSGIGLEGAGVITDVGGNVKNFKDGDKIENWSYSEKDIIFTVFNGEVEGEKENEPEQSDIETKVEESIPEEKGD